MKFIILSALLSSVPVMASAQVTPDREAELLAAVDDVIACANTEVAKVAPLTSEPASDMANLIVTRCNTGDASHQAVFQVLPIRSLAMDAIVSWRTGDKKVLVNPLRK